MGLVLKRWRSAYISIALTSVRWHRLKIFATIVAALAKLKLLAKNPTFGFEKLSYCNFWAPNVYILKTIGRSLANGFYYPPPST
jgi:hypothetical protein